MQLLSTYENNKI